MAALITTPRLMAIGGGALAELPALLARLGLAQPLIVTDPFIASSGHPRPGDGAARRRGIAVVGVFRHRVRPDDRRSSRPASSACARATSTASSRSAAAARSTPRRPCRCSHANGGQMRDYKVPNDIPKIGPPIVAIPTTAGTGSEVTRFTVITDTETDEKMLIAGLACCPTAAIVDYELTLTMPLRLTADTGHRQPDARDRGLCQPPRQPVHRRPRQERDGAHRAAISAPPAPSPTTAPRARR